MIRIVAGRYGGRTIVSPRGDGTTRPTTDKVREALMSSLISRIGGTFEGLRVLDAFAGTGALGFEALSRGAAHCTFFDIDRGAVRLIRDNAGRLGVADGEITVRNIDAFLALKKGFVTGPFDLVFLDPPYATDAEAVCTLVKALADDGRLAGGAVVVYEHASGGFDPDIMCCAGTIDLLAQRRYGKTEVCMVRYRGEGQT